MGAGLRGGVVRGTWFRRRCFGAWFRDAWFCGGEDEEKAAKGEQAKVKRRRIFSHVEEREEGEELIFL